MMLINHFTYSMCEVSPHLDLLGEYRDPVLQCHLLPWVTMMSGCGGGRDAERRRESSQRLLEPEHLLGQLCYLHKDRHAVFG